MERAALFLDRDGIINRRIVGGYVRTPAEFELLQDVLPILRRAHERGMLLVLITNQQGVGKGLMTEGDLNVVHTHMQTLLQHHLGFQLDAIYSCTDIASEKSIRRKPHPTMLLEAIREHNIDPNSSWFLGDSITDAIAGRLAGVRTVLIGSFNKGDADVVKGTLRDVAL